MGKNIENKEKDISKIIILISIGIAAFGFILAIIGAFLNGLSIFYGESDLKQGFGLILMGDSIGILGVVINFIIIILNIMFDKNFGDCLID